MAVGLWPLAAHSLHIILTLGVLLSSPDEPAETRRAKTWAGGTEPTDPPHRAGEGRGKCEGRGRRGGREGVEAEEGEEAEGVERAEGGVEVE